MKRYLITTVLMMIIIFSFSNQPADISSGSSDLIVDFLLQFKLFAKIFLTHDTLAFVVRKLAHFTIYFLLGLNSFLLFYHANDERNWHYESKIILLISLVFCLLYAISDEFHQSFIVGRGPSSRDVMIDACGFGIANLLLFKFKRNNFSKK